MDATTKFVLIASINVSNAREVGVEIAAIFTDVTIVGKHTVSSVLKREV